MTVYEGGGAFGDVESIPRAKIQYESIQARIAAKAPPSSPGSFNM
jgi:hypothetical protein